MITLPKQGLFRAIKSDSEITDVENDRLNKNIWKYPFPGIC